MLIAFRLYYVCGSQITLVKESGVKHLTMHPHQKKGSIYLHSSEKK